MRLCQKFGKSVHWDRREKPCGLTTAYPGVTAFVGHSPHGYEVRLACVYSNGCKSPASPYSGNRTAESKGVRGDAGSEGSRRQTSGLTYRNLIQGMLAWISLLLKTKSDSYTETPGVYQAGIRRKECMLNEGGLADVPKA